MHREILQTSLITSIISPVVFILRYSYSGRVPYTWQYYYYIPYKASESEGKLKYLYFAGYFLKKVDFWTFFPANWAVARLSLRVGPLTPGRSRTQKTRLNTSTHLSLQVHIPKLGMIVMERLYVVKLVQLKLWIVKSAPRVALAFYSQT